MNPVFRLLIISLLIWRVSLVSHAVGQGLSAQQQAAVDALPEVPAKLNPGFWIQREEDKTVAAKLGITITTPSFAADTWIFAMPEPPATPGQRVLEFRTEPASQVVQGKTPLERSIHRCRIDVKEESERDTAGMECNYSLQLYRRSLQHGRRPRRTSVEMLEDEQKGLFLRPNKECDYNAADFQSWKSRNQFTRQRREGEIGFAMRVFQGIVGSYTYQYVPKQDRTASVLCKTDKTDCGGLSTLFVTTMRSEGIPARVLVGRWAKSAVDGQTVDGQRYYQYHVIAEFYAQGVGWVPVDLSSAILHDRTRTKLRFFGNDPANFVTMHLDTGVEFETDLYGDYRAIYFQIPMFWTKGRGTIDDRTLDERWVVTESARTTGVKPMADKGKPKADYVFLPITHLQQSKNMCAPTSASMALLHHGARVPPLKIKSLANAVTTKPDFPGTYFEDLVEGLKPIGVSWDLKYFKTTEAGFDTGLAQIIESLDQGNPVIVDTNVPPDGHTVLVNGYDPNRKLISIVDPLLPKPGLRRLTYDEFKRDWRSLTADIRGAIFTRPPAGR